ncbi:hypothetical protein LFL96_36790 (plasmid) [Paraburkholderia sp. D15]|uniref:hypothetical protein n=1 Tax=Paraburkholderia sp. D15 TaxID=2880218 RepID=UPI002479239D|nr:hypothetical protein [Paraburkholderia sp. D15]WGS55036.1 hypothetical protein LFL96_36790 [Paraburkholderia sp. D15]
MKRFVFYVWMAVWISICCYGFRIMPHALAEMFDASWKMLTSDPSVPVFMDMRPGSFGMGVIALIGGGFVTIGVYCWAFAKSDDHD